MKISVLALPAILAGNNKAGYTKYTKCLDIDDKGNRVQYRYFCNQGSFFVQVSPCNYLDDKWIIRFEALDRLGGCINVMDKRKSATIETSIATCDTIFEKKNGKVKIENKLYIFRSIEDQVFDENVYPLSCSYEESSEFSFDLSKNVDGSGFLDNNLQLKFWTDSNFNTELSERTWRVGQPVYFTLNWVERIFDSNFVVEDCFWNDESEAKTYHIIQDGCASSLVDAQRYTPYSESTDNYHKFEFKAFAFAHQSHKVSMTCRVKVCLADEQDCNQQSAACPSGYYDGSSNQLL